ncbi:MAG: hypothetical protein MUQ30_01190 [Anaerolineae bacterium]|nr:hypothetical protein [Anaerolineae bacterium]
MDQAQLSTQAQMKAGRDIEAVAWRISLTIKSTISSRGVLHIVLVTERKTTTSLGAVRTDPMSGPPPYPRL